MTAATTIASILSAAAALAVAAPAVAQTNAAAPVTKPAAAQSGNAKASPRMATHTTKTGKKITYDCSKKGNANKKACKG